jgi:hypothetical protein
LVLKGQPQDLPVYKIPVKYLYFNIENGRYADRMIRLKAENPGKSIDPRSPDWKKTIWEILMAKGKSKDQRDTTASARLLEDMRERHTQLVPGIVAGDGGVLDGNRRLAVIMDLKWEHFDGVIIPESTSREDMWRIEAGIQLGRPLIHAYSPVNELLKIREGLNLFRDLKAKGQDPAPKKTPEELVAETLYGLEPSDVQESIERITLIDQYLAFIGKPERYDLLGDRAERFKEAVKIVRAARNQGWEPDDFAKLKAFLFNQILTENLENWDLRLIYQAIGGDPGTRGKKPQHLSRSEKLLLENLPPVAKIQQASRTFAAVEETQGRTRLDKETDDAVKKANELGDDFKHAAEAEKRTVEPLKLLREVLQSMERITEQKASLVKPESRGPALKTVKEIKKIAEDLHTALQR